MKISLVGALLIGLLALSLAPQAYAVRHACAIACIDSYVLNADTDTVYFFTNYIDITSAGYIYGATFYHQITASPNRGEYVDQNTGRPLVSGSFVLMGGPLANKIVGYYEGRTGFPLQAPIHYGSNATHNLFLNPQDQVVAGIRFDANYSGNDMFVIQSFIDDEDNYVLMVWGTNTNGTLAGGIYLIDEMNRHLWDYGVNNVYIVEWKDGTGGALPDGLPQKEEMTVVHEDLDMP